MARRRITELVEKGRRGAQTPPPTGPSGVLGPDGNNVIPGEVVVALEADAAAGVTASIPASPTRGAVAAVDAFGNDDLDTAFADLGVESIVRVHGATPPQAVNGISVADDLGLDGTFRIRYSAAEDPVQAAARLQALPQVAWAEPNYLRESTATTPNDPQFGTQWGLARINAPAAWDVTKGSPSVVVAVVDSGVDLNHPDLAGLLLPGQDLVDLPAGSTPQPGWVYEGDFMGVDADPQDEVGHGTHVAGTICALSNNAVGVAGVNWNCRLLPVRVLARGRNTTTNQVKAFGSSANIAAGIRWAADNGARVINLSLGGYNDAMVEREAVAYAVSCGVVVVAAMGNDNVTTPHYPSAYPDVVAVAATDSADVRASFSNMGSWVDVSGPGVGVVSTYWDDTYASLSGTSMATPHVAGVAALILAANPALTAAQVADILRQTAKPLRDTAADPVPNDRYGFGLVQADAAVFRAKPAAMKSRLILCESRTVLCQPSNPVTCEPSVVVLCQPSTRTICQASVITLCRSKQVLCQPTRLGCPSATVICSSLRCPSLVCNSVVCDSAVCGPGPFGPGGAQPGGQAGSEEDWSAYDPYGVDPYGTEYE